MFLESYGYDYDTEGWPGWLLLAGPAGAVAVYTALYRYYRNTDKSHHFERDTLIESQPVTGGDQKVDEVRGTKRQSIDGNNKHTHRARVQRVQ
ncbi:MAG: hypothetical protein GX862_09920 [Leucobacter sp.]|nr:hypothetical protein [Leucobacter sp.]